MNVSAHDRLALFDSSIKVIQANQASTGAYLASPNFHVYRYCWLRDGAFIADAMSRAGHGASAEEFFGWCSRLLVARESNVESLIAKHQAGQPIDTDEFLHARYTVDGKEAEDEWRNFQLDGYGTWLWALGVHHRRWPASDLQTYRSGIELCIKYLTEFWREPSYDWWEENAGHRHTSTLAAIYAGLHEAAGMDILASPLRALAREVAERIRLTVVTEGRHDTRLAKWLGGDAVDAILIACGVPLGLLSPDDPVMLNTIGNIESSLAHGGVHRYLADTYYGGGEWPLLSALLGWHYISVGRHEDAWRELDWIVRQATPDGELPEQVSDHLLAPDAMPEWVKRWGLVATPLLWSHAMFLTLAIELGVLRPAVRD